MNLIKSISPFKYKIDVLNLLSGENIVLSDQICNDLYLKKFLGLNVVVSGDKEDCTDGTEEYQNEKNKAPSNPFHYPILCTIIRIQHDVAGLVRIFLAN